MSHKDARAYRLAGRTGESVRSGRRRVDVVRLLSSVKRAYVCACTFGCTALSDSERLWAPACPLFPRAFPSLFRVVCRVVVVRAASVSRVPVVRHSITMHRGLLLLHFRVRRAAERSRGAAGRPEPPVATTASGNAYRPGSGGGGGLAGSRPSEDDPARVWRGLVGAWRRSRRDDDDGQAKSVLRVKILKKAQRPFSEFVYCGRLVEVSTLYSRHFYFTQGVFIIIFPMSV